MSTERSTPLPVHRCSTARGSVHSRSHQSRQHPPRRLWPHPTINSLAMIFCLASAYPAAAQTTWYVDLANCPGPGSGTEADPFCKIQHGIDAASDGDTVLIADGTYTGVNNKNLTFNGKATTVQSQNGPENCIIDCEHAGRGFVFASGETGASVLAGVTMTRGRVSGPGGGIYCVLGSPTITGCKISECEANGGHGGGLYFSSGGAPLIVSDCEISNNFAANTGGGVHSAPGSAQISMIRCVVWGNTAVQGGGGLALAGGSVEISGCNIWDNIAGYGYGGGGLMLYGESAEISGCNIWGNSAGSVGGGVYGELSGPINIAGSEIWGNTSEYGYGGGLWLSGGVLQINGCSIWANFAGQNGGGAHVEDSALSSVIQDCLIEGNQAESGGGLSVWGTLEVSRCTISGNGAQYGGGGIRAVNGEGTLAIDACRIEGNFSSESGGGIELFNIYPYPATIRNSVIANNATLYAGAGVRIVSGGYCPSIVGCTIASNEVLAPGYAGGGGVSYTANSNATCAINDSILWNNAATPGDEVSLNSDDITLTVAHSDVAGGLSQIFVGGNSSVAWGPGNIDQDPLFANPLAGNYHLSAGSPCIDAGDPAFVPEPDETDMDGEVRVADGMVDIGADEFHDCDLNQTPSSDCNGNGKSDVCDISGGLSEDCNLNGVPDSCDVANGFSEDCNYNGIPDQCEVTSGGSPDKDANGIPDECECPADINGDGMVGPVDLAVLLGLWGSQDPLFGDVNHDGEVDPLDLALVLGSWGNCLIGCGGAQCNDGDLCNGAETCIGNVCQPGLVLECEDGNPCTLDGCDPHLGCVHQSIDCGDGPF